MNQGLIKTINLRIIYLNLINYLNLFIIISTMIYWLIMIKR